MADKINWNKVGRPCIYENKEELQKDIDKYFKSCWVVEEDKQGIQHNVQIKPYTMSGLARAIGMDRRTLLNYSKKEEFFLTIKEAKKLVEEYAESRLFDRDGNRGAIFNLQNNFNGWEDRKKVENEIKTNPADELIKSIEELKQK